MKLFHLSDLHIGTRVNEFSMIEDQKYILKRILAVSYTHLDVYKRQVETVIGLDAHKLKRLELPDFQ